MTLLFVGNVFKAKGILTELILGCYNLLKDDQQTMKLSTDFRHLIML